jgi:hypothetical protein
MEQIPEGTRICFQLLRGKDEQEAIAEPLRARVVRTSFVGEHVDHGVAVEHEDIKPEVRPRPARPAEAPRAKRSAEKGTRMHIMDIRNRR